MKTTIRKTLVTLLVLAGAPLAHARVAGGGPVASDCYAEFDGVTANRGRTRVVCHDGDPTCDGDAAVNGRCVFAVGVCVHQTDVEGCEAPDVTELGFRTSAFATPPGLPALPAVAPACGTPGVIELPLTRGRRPSRTLRLKLVARADGRPATDVDHLSLKCLPSIGSGQCDDNPAGGPKELRLTVLAEGSDLDNGWSGTSHNLAIPSGTTIRMCVGGCDAAGAADCVEDEARTREVNGRTFGPPLPLLAGGVPACIVNRYDAAGLTAGRASLATGAMSVGVNLLSDVYLTSALAVCPACSGSEIGAPGVCQGGARDGGFCVTEGIGRVTTAAGTRALRLSSACPPDGTPVGTIPIPMMLTTGASALAGPRPCGASHDDGCPGGETCSATCTGNACVALDAAGRCVDAKGGVAQLCCSGRTDQPCFATAPGTGATIERAGNPAAPSPAGEAFPKTASPVLAATFCEAATASAVVNMVSGLPGPGALILPVSACWLRTDLDGIGCP